MRFEISERVMTTRSDQDILVALQSQFQKVARRVDVLDQRIKATSLEASFGSINRKDETLVYLKPIEGGQLLVADVLYRPSLAFWVILIITAFSAVGWIIPIAFYLLQKKTVTQAVRACFERVQNEFTQSGGAARPQSPISFEDALEQLGRLKEKGLLTDEEFTARKQALMDSPSPGSTLKLSATNMPKAATAIQSSSRPTNALQLDHDIPPGIKGWSWGAFFLNFFWAIPNKTWIGLLTAIPIIGFPMPFILGFKGREWAWRNRQWDSVEHFNRVQRQWTVTGVIFYVVALSIIIVGKAYPLLEAKFNPPDEGEHSAQRELGGKQQASSVQQEIPQSVAAIDPASTPQAAANAIEGSLGYQDVNMAFTADTAAGKISMGLDAQQHAHILLNGSPIFKGDPAIRRTPVKLFDLSGHRQALLVASVGGRGKCDTLYFFIILNQTQGASWTPEFGSCVGEGRYIQTGDRIDLTIPDNGLTMHVRFENDQVTENGHVIAFHPDSDDIAPIQ